MSRRKQPTLLIIASVILAACTLAGCSGSSFKRNPADITRTEAWNTACAITYRSEEPDKDYWQTPGETLMLGYGDCEDKALLLWYTLRHVHGVKSARFVVGRTHRFLNKCPHAWVEVGAGFGILILDPTAKEMRPRYMYSIFAYEPMRHPDLDIKANVFMDVTGYRNLNPATGWK